MRLLSFCPVRGALRHLVCLRPVRANGGLETRRQQREEAPSDRRQGAVSRPPKIKRCHQAYLYSTIEQNAESVNNGVRLIGGHKLARSNESRYSLVTVQERQTHQKTPFAPSPASTVSMHMPLERHKASSSRENGASDTRRTKVVHSFP